MPSLEHWQAVGARGRGWHSLRKKGRALPRGGGINKLVVVAVVCWMLMRGNLFGSLGGGGGAAPRGWKGNPH